MRYQGIEEALEQEGVYVSTTIGYSMWPMLRNRRDTIIVEPVDEEAGRLDTVLYQTKPDSYVLHRIIGEDGEQWIICGDNNTQKEWVDKKSIIGKLTAFYRGERYITVTGLWYRCYAHVWCDTVVVKSLVKLIMRYGHAVKVILNKKS